MEDITKEVMALTSEVKNDLDLAKEKLDAAEALELEVGQLRREARALKQGAAVKNALLSSKKVQAKIISDEQATANARTAAEKELAAIVGMKAQLEAATKEAQEATVAAKAAVKPKE